MIRRSTKQWLTLFQQQTESGLSAAEFCKQQGLCDKHFSLRKKQLTSSSAEFIPVVKQKKVKVSELPDRNLYIQCRFERCVLQFDSLPDVTWLSQLIRALS